MCQLTVGAGRWHLITSPRPHRYLMSRGLTEDQATSMIVAGFIEPIFKELPMEYCRGDEPADRDQHGRGRRSRIGRSGVSYDSVEDPSLFCLIGR